MENETNNGTLLDTVHRCLMCNAIAYKISDGEFVCSVCGFKWTVGGHA